MHRENEIQLLCNLKLGQLNDCIRQLNADTQIYFFTPLSATSKDLRLHFQFGDLLVVQFATQFSDLTRQPYHLKSSYIINFLENNLQSEFLFALVLLFSSFCSVTLVCLKSIEIHSHSVVIKQMPWHRLRLPLNWNCQAHLIQLTCFLTFALKHFSP